MFPLIQLDGICKFYGNGDGKVIALNDVSLNVKKGDILATMYTSKEELFVSAEEKYYSAITIGTDAVTRKPLVYARVTKDGVEKY